ncbi:MAG: YggS family pyridoxal phosphate-dependent enzyme, partial [Nitrospirae bacterium]|nr:YggS family pyridoxal phosphate-dependent enzyme [Nitrospirota bacterium]
VKYVVGAFTLIHSVDSIELSEEINRRAEKMGIIQDVLLEVNVSGERRKFGVMPDNVITITKAFSKLRHVSLRGFMTVPPYSDNPEEARPYFRMLREIRDNVRHTGSVNCGELSMGMSNDFEVAIEEGATMVRIGTALFGTRERKVNDKV